MASGDVARLDAELRERVDWRATAKARLAEAIERAIAAQHAYDQAVATVRDARGIIAEETEEIDQLLEKLHALIPQQRTATD